MAKKVEGRVEAVIVDTDHVSVHVSADQPADTHLGGVTVVKLYEHDPSHPVAPSEGMRRGAMLSLAERAFTHRHSVSVEVSETDVARSIKIFFPEYTVPLADGPKVDPVDIGIP